MQHPASQSDEQLLADCDVQRTRRGGPGGQHRNKVSTAVVIRHRPTGVVAEASERRSQQTNLSMAIHRLRLHLSLAIRTGWSQSQKPSSLWTGRVANGRIRVSPEHPDFPALLAEALDHVAGLDYSIPDSAASLGITGSQLLRLLRSEGAAWVWLNRHRADRGMKRLD